MRKKAHRRINANNHQYDRFYVINYLVRKEQFLVEQGSVTKYFIIKSSEFKNENLTN